MITFGSACLMRTDNSRAAKPATKIRSIPSPIFLQTTLFVFSFFFFFPRDKHARFSNVYHQKPANGRRRVEQQPAWLQPIIVDKNNIIIYINLLPMASRVKGVMILPLQESWACRLGHCPPFSRRKRTALPPAWKPVRNLLQIGSSYLLKSITSIVSVHFRFPQKIETKKRAVSIDNRPEDGEGLCFQLAYKLDVGDALL